MKKNLEKFKENVNALDEQGDAVLHCLVKKPFTKKKLSLKRDLVATLLTYTDAKVNLARKPDKLTPLHLAAKVCVSC